MASHMLTALLLLFLPAAVSAGALEEVKAEAPKTPTAEDKERLVQAFLDTPTIELPPDLIPEFLALAPEELPEKLRPGFAAKRLELYTLKQIVEGKKKGGVRMPEENCSLTKDAKGDSVGIVRAAGFVEINDEEERWVMDKTKCTEHDLQCEFTLQIVAARVKNKKASYVQRFLFMHPKDPIFALIAQYREMGRVKQTNFFGIGSPVCAPRLK